MKSRLPVARADRRPLFAGRVDTITLDDGREVAVRAPVVPLETKRFLDRAYALAPQTARVAFKDANGLVLEGCLTSELIEAVIELWSRRRRRLPPAELVVAKAMVKEFIRTITSSGQGMAIIEHHFGDAFDGVRRV
jgi:hypothetical protein